MTIDWRLGLAPDIGGNMLQSFQQGQQQKMQGNMRNALADYVTNQSPAALDYITRNDPQAGMQLRQDAAAQQNAAMDKHLKDMQVMDRLLSQATPENWQNMVNIASQYGLDVSGVPQGYDPQWVQSTHALVAAMSDKDTLSKLPALAQEVMLALPPEHRDIKSPVFIKAMGEATSKMIATEPGGGALIRNPITGEVKTLVAPNPGGFQTGSPVSDGSIQEGQTATNPQTGEKIQFRNGQWVPMGGTVSNGGGNFQAGQ